MNLNTETLTLPHHFHAVAERHPARLALVTADRQLSYQELDRQSTRLAHQLLTLGVERGQLIGLQCKLSVEAVIGVWGILKAGAAFVPLDPDYPSDRINYLLNDARLGLVLSRRADASKLFEHQAKVLYLDEMPMDGSSDNEPLADIKPEHLACCLYTSGSTGQPKGVMLEHQALLSHYFSLQQHYQLTEADRVLQFASFNHIAGVEHFIMALLSGATLVVPGQQLWTANEFLPKAKTYGLTLVDLPASYYQVLAREWASTHTGLEGSPIRLFIVGGEASSAEACTLWGTLTAANIRFLNVYGMTEVSGTATLFGLPHGNSQQGNTLPIGLALPARTAQILDDDLQPVPDGETGEICLSGIGLARGYLNQPALTAEKFVRHPKTQERLYRTGDWGRLLPDGNLEYRGRLDHQVQIRGFRVELGEIEQTLLAHPKVEEAAVVAFGEDTEKQLVAYAACPVEASIWQVQGSYRDEPGVIVDSTERLEFKLKQVNIQSFTGTEITLAKPAMDEAWVQNYLSRQSYRQFAQQPIPLDALSQLLSCLMQLKLPDAPIPKYRYPSALGLYPVQTYLQIKPGRVEGMAGGFYYYHPQEHRLQLIAEHLELGDDVYGGYNQAITRQAAFSLLLVAHLEAIKPLYGQKLAEKFCIVEAGYMGQLLMTEAPNQQLGLCPLGELTEFEKTAHAHHLLEPSDLRWVVNGFLGGAIEPSQSKTWLQETSHQQSPVELKAGLKTYLQEKLPAHMVPEQYVLCEVLPKTPNGKIDRLALAGMNNWDDVNTPQPYVAPNTVTEQHIAKIWQELFKVEQVSVNDEFFALGGNSLLALNLLSRIRQQFQLSLSLQTLLTHNTVESLAKQLEILNPVIRTVVDDEQQGIDYLRNTQTTTVLPQAMPDLENCYSPFPLTDIQEAYWLGQNERFELHTPTHAYEELACQGLETERLEQAWQQLVRQHGMLRAIILPSGEQQILEEVPLYAIKRYDLAQADEATIARHLETVRREMFNTPFSSACWPLFDIRFTQLAAGKLHIHLSLDMLIADWGSYEILLREWAQLYHQPRHPLLTPALSFRDYVVAEKKLKETALYQQSAQYWLQRLASLPPAPELPLALEPSTLKSPQFKRHQTSVEAKDWSRIKAKATQFGLTSTSLLLTVFAEILTRWSKRPQFSLNLTLFNRLTLFDQAQIDQIVGDFTSLTLLAVDHSNPSETLAERGKRLQSQLWHDLDHRYFSGIQVLRALSAQQDGAGQVLMPIVFTSGLGVLDKGGGWLGETVYGLSQTPQVWLDSQAEETEGHLRLTWDVVEALFPPGLIETMFSAYSSLLKLLAMDENLWQASQLDLLPPMEQQQRRQINGTQAAISDELLHTLFVKQAEANPRKTAVIAVNRELSYGWLYQEATQIARWLRANGAKANQLVAVVMDKGWEQVVAVMGVLLSGSAYLPIDPELPVERQHYLLDQAQVRLVLTQPHIENRLTWPDSLLRFSVDQEKLSKDQNLTNLEILQSPADLAYVIYTSGSTGQPKGVMIDHRGAVNTILDINRRFAVSSKDKVLALSALNFDLSVYDIFGLLAVGGTIVMPSPEGRRDPAHWAGLINSHGVTLWDTVPALMQMLVESEAGRCLNSPLRLILMSGDWIPLDLPERIRQTMPEATLMSLGGATEASIWSIYYPIKTIDPAWHSIPYGKPLGNQCLHVLNARLEACPTWVTGQLYIGGIGLALGYWQDEEKTHASFISHPKTGERLYKTGDLGRHLPDGNIEFLGRDDFQVKIRGHRIELGEIEANLLKHPRIKEAVVAAIGETRHSQQLVAYIVPIEEETSPGQAQDIDQAIYGLQVMQGVLTDPAERLQFKLDHRGVRQFENSRPEIKLPLVDVDDTAYLARQSYRQFLAEPVKLVQLSQLLSSLNARFFPEGVLPKYQYASAGSLYPVQCYLAVKTDRVTDLEGGFYYYHPLSHKLVSLSSATDKFTRELHGGTNQDIFDQSAFSLFLVAESQAIEPMYGASSRDFCLLEAGYMSQLLMMKAASHNLGLCPIGGMNAQPITAELGLTDSQELVHSFLGGGICTEQTQRLNQSVAHSESLEESLQAFLSQKLAHYMVPKLYIQLTQLPLTANGKVNRKALPKPELNKPNANFVEAGNELEQRLIKLLQGLFDLNSISMTDDFFELGANSFDMVQLQLEIKTEFHCELSMTDIFNHTTAQKLSKLLKQVLEKTAEAPTPTPAETISSKHLSPEQIDRLSVDINNLSAAEIDLLLAELQQKS